MKLIYCKRKITEKMTQRASYINLICYDPWGFFYFGFQF